MLYIRQSWAFALLCMRHHDMCVALAKQCGRTQWRQCTRWPRQLSKTAVVSLLALSDGSQVNKVVCRGTGDDLKLALVTLTAVTAVEAAQSKPSTQLA